MVFGAFDLSSSIPVFSLPPLLAANPACRQTAYEVPGHLLPTANPPGLTWKGLQGHVRQDVMATANHDRVKGGALLLASALGDNLPLARG